MMEHETTPTTPFHVTTTSWCEQTTRERERGEGFHPVVDEFTHTHTHHSIEHPWWCTIKPSFQSPSNDDIKPWTGIRIIIQSSVHQPNHRGRHVKRRADALGRGHRKHAQGTHRGGGEVTRRLSGLRSRRMMEDWCRMSIARAQRTVVAQRRRS